VLWIPPVVIGGVEIAQHLLRRLRRQVGQPGEFGAALGQLPILPDCPERHAALGPGELPLRKRDVPYRTRRMTPTGQPLRLSHFRVQPIAASHIRLHAAHSARHV
jgi:hypothetical protein